MTDSFAAIPADPLGAEPGFAPDAAPWDEMVDGSGGLRPAWRSLLATLSGLGHDELRERAAQLDRLFAEEGVASLLPGAAPVVWRRDPVPLKLGAAEFAQLEAGLAQRARLLEAVLADIYGPQDLLATGALPPALIFGNPAFLRACRSFDVKDGTPPRPGRGSTLSGPRLHYYAAELVRGADGGWRVLADRTADAAGIAYAVENRRAMARVVPELFRARYVRRLAPFIEAWQDALQRLSPVRDGAPGLALLTPGPMDKLWYEHVVLARELACPLVESGDLTVRDGVLYLKTLRGLQRVDVLLRRQDGRMLDSLELDSRPGQGVAGLLDAARAGNLRIVNDPGAGCAEAPALAAFLPGLARRLLGEELSLPQVATHWLGDPASLARVVSDLAAWRIRPALDGTVPAVAAGSLSAAGRAKLEARLRDCPADFVASDAVAPSLVPCVGQERLVPRPVVLRMFLMHDGTAWRAMPGGLARTLSDRDLLIGRLPLHSVTKDVWVAAEDEAEIVGPAHLLMPALAIRRTHGDLPSRAADNFFWLGRYLERLEATARLLRTTIARLERPAPTPREEAELDSLSACLVDARLLDAEDARGLSPALLGQSLLRTARAGGALHRRVAEISRLSAVLRDRLTREVHATIAQGLRTLGEQLGQVPPAREGGAGLEALLHATSGVLVFSAAVAGLAAENMVRGGGRLFLDLGRRVERAWASAGTIATVLHQPGVATQPGRLEPGLRLALELCDSVITYRSRYLSVLQPAPVLDLVLADEGNPRALAFQFLAARDLLAELAGNNAAPLAAEAGALLAETQAMVREVARAPEQGPAAAALPDRLRDLEDATAALSTRISRRYFALLAPPRRVGVEGEVRRLRGMA